MPIFRKDVFFENEPSVWASFVIKFFLKFFGEKHYVIRNDFVKILIFVLL